MSKLTNLIKQLCPDGVEYKMLKDICVLSAGGDVPKNRLSKEKNNTYNVPIISNGIGNNAINGYTDIAKINSPAVTISARGTIGYCELRAYPFYPVVRLICAIPRKEILPDFLKFYLETVQFHVPKVGIPQLTVPMVGKYQVPVPPLEVQAEIVRILDTFTELTTELATELTNRKKQFEYYRDKLLSYDDTIRLEELGVVAKVTKLAGFEFTKYVQYSDTGRVIALRGLNVKDGKLILDDVKYIDNSDLSKLDRSKLRVGDMLFTYVGTVGQVALIDENDKYYLAPNVAMIRIEDERLLPKYLMYYFQSSIFKEKQINRLLQSSSMKNIPMEKIRKFLVPIPSIQTQQRIIAVLDNFEAICSDLNIGLPAEIEARQKQYEYYRDKLLTFKEKKAI